ncbi:MAG: putative DNA binding domain-containing protein [Clostridiales Family XIII bacterium]|jgi:ATP-dependent DNA helicase RecG|nr:putative DNA binding domain-containing protein [Clostridiales Family XIII bacterium]
MIENTSTEFKSVYNDKVNKVLLSFLNTDGGTLYIGIADDGNVVGVDDVDGLLLKAVNSFRDSINPDPTGYFNASPIRREGKTVVEISVERGAALPYCLKSHGLVPQGVYVRIGSESVSASREHIKQMIRENDGEKFIEALSLNQELTFDYAARIFGEKDVVFGETQRKSLGLIRADGRYSNLALILSDQCPYSVKAAIFGGMTKETFKDRNEFTGSVFRQIDEVLAYLNVYNKVASTFEGAYRIDRPDYPEIVLREALLNAIIHRDYYIEGSILVSVFDDRLEIMSLGGIMPGVTRELMRAGVSVPRNEKLAAVFHRLKLIEAYGTGIPRIFETYAKFGVSPAIPITSGGFLISLPNLNHVLQLAAKPLLTDKEQKIADFFKSEFTKQETAELLGISLSGAYKLLQRMVERELLSYRKVGKEKVYIVRI